MSGHSAYFKGTELLTSSPACDADLCACQMLTTCGWNSAVVKFVVGLNSASHNNYYVKTLEERSLSDLRSLHGLDKLLCSVHGSISASVSSWRYYQRLLNTADQVLGLEAVFEAPASLCHCPFEGTVGYSSVHPFRSCDLSGSFPVYLTPADGQADNLGDVYSWPFIRHHWALLLVVGSSGSVY